MANAKPTSGANNQVVKTNAPVVPKTMTMVRCPVCDVKRCIELKPVCECGGAKKKTAKGAKTPDAE